MYKVVLIDDHQLLRSGLAGLVSNYPNFKVLFEADNGKDFIAKLNPNNLPHIVMMDITMPEMDGYATTKWLKEHHPKVKVLALSMMDDEYAIIRMLRCGARGYVVKNTKTKELQLALTEILQKGFYFNDQVSTKIANSIYGTNDEDGKLLEPEPTFTPKEMQFLLLTVTEKTYKQIADEMEISPRTVDSYRDSVFDKLKIKSRIGLVIYAIKHNLIKI
jgi:DNA-binding NarL/FixJ family response regulator